MTNKTVSSLLSGISLIMQHTLTIQIFFFLFGGTYQVNFLLRLSPACLYSLSSESIRMSSRACPQSRQPQAWLLVGASVKASGTEQAPPTSFPPLISVKHLLRTAASARQRWTLGGQTQRPTAHFLPGGGGAAPPPSLSPSLLPSLLPHVPPPRSPRPPRPLPGSRGASGAGPERVGGVAVRAGHRGRAASGPAAG